jgi:hypothetical protein
LRREAAHVLAGFLAVDTHLHVVVAIHDRIERDHRDSGSLCHADGRLDAVDVDGADDDGIDLVVDVGFDGVVLGGRAVVGVEDDQFGARVLRSLTAPSLICMKNRACWLTCTSAIFLALAAKADMPGAPSESASKARNPRRRSGFEVIGAARCRESAAVMCVPVYAKGSESRLAADAHSGYRSIW